MDIAPITESPSWGTALLITLAQALKNFRSPINFLVSFDEYIA